MCEPRRGQRRWQWEHLHEPVTFRHAALEARIECIAGEEGEQVRLVLEGRIGTVVIAQRLEASDAADRFARTGPTLSVVRAQDQ